MKEFILDQNKIEEKLYTKKGLESFIDEENFPRLNTNGKNVFAKAVRNKKSKNISHNNLLYSYFILTEPDKKPYDPSIKHTIEPKVSKNFINKICKSSLIFTEVNYSIFRKYITFLTTENKKLLQEIQREIK